MITPATKRMDVITRYDKKMFQSKQILYKITNLTFFLRFWFYSQIDHIFS